MQLDVHVHFHLAGVGEIIDGQKRQEAQMANVRELINRLTTEAAETRGLMQSATAVIRGIPDLIRAAVEEALAANPDLTPEDLAAVTDAADQLDAAQAELQAALSENPAGEQGGGEVEQPEGGEGEAPVEGEEQVPAIGEQGEQEPETGGGSL